ASFRARGRARGRAPELRRGDRARSDAEPLTRGGERARLLDGLPSFPLGRALSRLLLGRKPAHLAPARSVAHRTDRRGRRQRGRPDRPWLLSLRERPAWELLVAGEAGDVGADRDAPLLRAPAPPKARARFAPAERGRRPDPGRRDRACGERGEIGGRT